MTVSTQAISQPEQLPVILAISQQMEQINEIQFTGSLNFDAAQASRLRLFFVAGRLVWAGGGIHRLRRWRRLLKQICPEAIFALGELTPEIATPMWEYEALSALQTEKHISRAQARDLITTQIKEVLFDIVQLWSLADYNESQLDDQLRIKDAITLIPPQDLLPDLEQRWQAWKQAGMARHSPNLSPLLEHPELLKPQVAAITFSRLQQMLRGQHSLRELASLTHQDELKLSQVLVGYEQQGLLKMRTTTDTSGSIPTPHSRSRRSGNDEGDNTESLPPEATKTWGLTGLVQSSSNHSQEVTAQADAPIDNAGAGQGAEDAPLIMCVDDNEQVREQMGKVLMGHGYRYDSIASSVSAIERILEIKPDLIFIDLIMPEVSGHELCNQIRRVSRLQSIPLIILSSSDTVLDRVRGKLAGANEYLTKPASPDQIIHAVKRWLTAQAS